MTKLHPTLERLLPVLERQGSKAKTVRGMCRAIMAEPKFLKKFLNVKNQPMTASDWLLSEKKRKADPEAKRARDDKKFRKGYLAKLRRREHSAISYDGSTVEGIGQRADSEATRIAELTECARLRSIISGEKVARTSLPVIEEAIVIRISESEAKKVKSPLCMRGRDARIIPSLKASVTVHTDGETTWKGSRPIKYTRAQNDNYVRSFCIVKTQQEIDCIFHKTRRLVTLPGGFHWSKDNDGLKAVKTDSPADDYHPSVTDLLLENAGEVMSKAILANRDRRVKLKAMEIVERAKVSGVFICFKDSVRAGNCEAGTRAFAERHGLSVTRHYSASEVLDMANGQADRVRLAVTAARIRHERELKAGVCMIEDHC